MINECIFVLHLAFLFACTSGAFFLGQHVLLATSALYIVFANIFVIKKMMLFGLTASGGDAYIVASLCALLMGQAVWGRDFARCAATIALCLALLNVALSWFQVAYVPAAIDTMQPIFAGVLGRVPAVTIFSALAHLVAQYITLGLTYTLSRMSSASWWLGGTSFVAMVLGQVVDGAIFFAGVFGREVSLQALTEMIGVSVGVKLGGMAIASLLVVGAHAARERGYV